MATVSAHAVAGIFVFLLGAVMALRPVSGQACLFGSDKTVTGRVAASEDDAEVTVNSTSAQPDYCTSSDMELVDDGGDQYVAMRFVADVPNGAQIRSAFISYTAKTSESGSSVQVYAVEASTNAQDFCGSSVPIKNRTWAASPTATLNPVQAWSAEGTYQSPDLAELVRAIVNRPGWSRNQSLAFRVSGSGLRRAYSFDSNPDKAPELQITYCDVAPRPEPACSTGAVEIVRTVDNSTDNGQAAGSSENCTGSTFTLGVVNTTGAFVASTVGLRFSLLGLPLGASVVSASLELFAASDSSSNYDNCGINIRATDAAGAGAFCGGVPIKSRTLLTETALWMATGGWLANAAQTSVDLSDVVSAAVATGTSTLALTLEPTNTYASIGALFCARDVIAFDAGDSLRRPTVRIKYCPAPVTTGVDTSSATASGTSGSGPSAAESSAAAESGSVVGIIIGVSVGGFICALIVVAVIVLLVVRKGKRNKVGHYMDQNVQNPAEAAMQRRKSMSMDPNMLKRRRSVAEAGITPEKTAGIVGADIGPAEPGTVIKAGPAGTVIQAGPAGAPPPLRGTPGTLPGLRLPPPRGGPGPVNPLLSGGAVGERSSTAPLGLPLAPLPPSPRANAPLPGALPLDKSLI